MIRITLFRQQNRWAGFCAEGHAGYAEEGEDIVCAAVYIVLTTNTVNAIETLTEEDFTGNRETVI